MRYSSDDMAKAYSDADRYVEFNRSSVVEMKKQVGDLVCDEDGIAQRGLIIRLLVLPEGVSGTKETLRFIAKEVSKNAYLSIMSQYYPTFKAYAYKALSRGVTQREYKEVVEEAARLGLENGWVQDLPSGVDARFAGTNIKPRRKKDA
jgi:putative pyruvate formate lyase activating enzyme